MSIGQTIEELDELDTCADCPKFELCNLIGNWYVKKGYYGEKYKQSLEYIKKNTYSEFIKLADKWKGEHAGPR